MLIDCDRCEMRDIACSDCVVTALIAGRNAAEMGGPARGADPAEIGGPALGADAAEIGRQEQGPDAAPYASNAARSPGADRPGQPAQPGQAHEAVGAGAPGPDIGEPERRALRTLAAAGLIPPLRLVLPESERAATGRDVADEFRDAEAS